jgi:hypothetical protein
MCYSKILLSKSFELNDFFVDVNVNLVTKEIDTVGTKRIWMMLLFRI